MIKNTNNSYINFEQIKEINMDNFQNALVKNRDYQINKTQYELTLLKYLISKYQKFENSESNISLNAVPCYENLMKKSKRFLEDFDKKMATNTLVNAFEVKEKSKSLLRGFIDEIKNFHENDYLGNEQGKATIPYAGWKKKISELVNIWELYSSNGTEMKFSNKYLPVKKFLNLRQFLKQNNLELGGGGGDDKKKKLSNESDNKNIPFLVLLSNSFLRYFIDLLIVIFLFYNLIMAPLKIFLKLSSTTITVLSKLTDIFFFAEIFINFRTAFQDKSNNIVYDTNKIFLNYLHSFFIIDLVSTMPFEFFFLGSSVFIVLETVRSSLKILRIAKLIPILTKLEETRAANYIRLLKLIFVFCFFAHWLGCMIFYTSVSSITWEVFNQTCYVIYDLKIQSNLQQGCQLLIAVYEGSYILASQYTSTMQQATFLSSATEYIIFIIEYEIGQLLSGYIFGGMASIIQNLNQGENFFTKKVDLLNEHMTFYEISEETQNDIRTYYSYLWQRHKDIIYSKSHFDLLSLSLREKFEQFNLVGSEIYLAKFYNLNIGNLKLIGMILMNLSKVIIFPYEILFEEASVCKGLYILLNGNVELITKEVGNFPKVTYDLDYDKIQKIKMNQLAEKKEEDNKSQKLKNFDESLSYIFPMIPILIKTGRNWQTCFSKEFTDLLHLPLDAFNKLVNNFPVEMHTLKHNILSFVEENKLFENGDLFKVLSTHSSRSVGQYYEKKYNKHNIWIPIPIPISQRKIAKNYISCFMRKVKNHWREILLSADVNIGFNSTLICSILKNSKEKKVDDKVDEAKNIKNTDILDEMKNISIMLGTLTKNISNSVILAAE